MMGVAFQLSVMLVFWACLFGLHSVSSTPLDAGKVKTQLLEKSVSQGDRSSDARVDRLKRTTFDRQARARDYDMLSSFYKRSDYPESAAESLKTLQDAPMYLMVPLARKTPAKDFDVDDLNDVSKRFYKRFYKRGWNDKSRFYLEGGNEPFYLTNNKRGYQSSFY